MQADTHHDHAFMTLQPLPRTSIAFMFGYALTMLPLLRSGIALGTAASLAFASDTVSITVMKIADNAIMLLMPGAMHALLSCLLFCGNLALALVIAGAFAFPLNRWLIARGRVPTIEGGYHACSSNDPGGLW